MSIANFTSGMAINDTNLNDLVDNVPKSVILFQWPQGFTLQVSGIPEVVIGPITILPIPARYLSFHAQVYNTGSTFMRATAKLQLHHIGGSVPPSPQLNFDNGSTFNSWVDKEGVIDCQSVEGKDIIGYMAEITLTFDNFGTGFSQFRNLIVQCGNKPNASDYMYF